MSRYKDHIQAAGVMIAMAFFTYLMVSAEACSWHINKWSSDQFTFFIAVEVLILLIAFIAILAQTPKK